ncbi:hypothetical protein GOP47_0006156 [Adiantum capillus-veneris]|uniref:Glutamate receptor n=1 Tax=Adiantum capillus-veneris TaxID=13818 RepID=A0A9D4V2X1_ADICA|nr:hypothetical protein GOP47_0006156 [Adiantum capillus-veneris]
MREWCYSITAASSASNHTNQWPPPSVKIGALLAFNTNIGEFARKAIELAVQDVNNAEDVLNGTRLDLKMYNTGCTPIQGAASAMELVKEGIIAVVGPQSSAVAQFVAHIGKETTIPLVSFGATDPNLSEMQYPFFTRVAPSDVLQMEAVAAFIANYGWREVVIFHMDDDYGTNGASTLSDSLQSRGSKLVDKVAFAPGIDKPGIDKDLARLANRQTRIFVVHTNAAIGLSILQEAYNLNMMVSGYVWIVTDIITTDLGYPNRDPRRQLYTQGIIGVRRHISQSPQLKSLLSSWKKSFPSDFLDLDTSQINAYGLYAYDAVWAVARAISSYLNDKQEVNFTKAAELPTESGGRSELAQMRRFEGGQVMKTYVLNTSFIGASGLIKFDRTGDLVGAAFEYVNMVGKSPHVVGYWWANNSGVSPEPPPNIELASLSTPEDNAFFLSHDGKPANSTKMAIIWSGGSTIVPQGWVLPKNGKPLKIGVPRKAGYTDLVKVTTDADNVTTYSGFCIQVFETALKYLHYAVPYSYETLGDGVTTPEYNHLIQKLANQEYDAVVGDVAVLADRLRIVDFTQPFLESGLVVLVPVRNNKKENPWAFLRPFKAQLWMTVLLSFVFTGTVIWILEHKVNEEFRGPPRAQLVTVLTFIFSTLFFAHREDARSFLGRAVLIVWLFVILIINSSYTANLTSILTVEHLAPAIQGLESLIQSNLPIGYQTGSFVRDYLKSLHVSSARLKPLSSLKMYEKALELGANGGGVAAIVDELPYVQLFHQSNCKQYIIAGQEFTKSGWGFAFPRGSDITADLSEAILKMSQSGELQHIKDYWFRDSICEEVARNAAVEATQLDLRSFWGLFLISGIASIVCVLIHMIFVFRKYRKEMRIKQQQEESVVLRPAGSLRHIKQFMVFLDKPACDHKTSARSSSASSSCMTSSHTSTSV